MPWFILDIDDFCENVFYRLEEISDKGHAHRCDIKAKNKDDAVEEVLNGLRSFIKKELIELRGCKNDR